MVWQDIQKFRRFLAARQEGALSFAAAAWVAAPLVEASLARRGLHQTLALADRVSSYRFAPTSWSSLPPAQASRLVDGVYRRHFVRGQCLSRSLVQYALQRSAGADVAFVIGARTRPSFHAHAWVESSSAPERSPELVALEPGRLGANR